MSACSPLHLVMEIPWPDSRASSAGFDRTLPIGNAALDRVIFPGTEEGPPASTIFLAKRLLQSRAQERATSSGPPRCASLRQ
jgi:hypothetical protein